MPIPDPGEIGGIGGKAGTSAMEIARPSINLIRLGMAAFEKGGCGNQCEDAYEWKEKGRNPAVKLGTRKFNHPIRLGMLSTRRRI